MESDLIAAIAFYAMLASCAAPVTWPWLTAKAARRRRTLALASAATVFFLLCNFATPSKYNIRIDFCFSVPALIVTWISHFVALFQSRRQQQ